MRSVRFVYSKPPGLRIAITVINLHSTGPLQPRLNFILFKLTLLDVQQAVRAPCGPPEVGPAHVIQSLDGETPGVRALSLGDPCLHAAAKLDD